MKVVTAAVIRRGYEILICDRPAGKPPAGWEFPGGKVEPGETPAAALRRELREELGVTALVLDPIFEETVPEKDLRLIFMRALPVLPHPDPVPQEEQHFRWVKIRDLPHCELLPADRNFASFLASAGNFTADPAL